MGGFQLDHASTLQGSKVHVLTNWTLSLMSIFYHQPGIRCPTYPPQLPIPGMENDDDLCGSKSPNEKPVSSRPQYMGATFPFLCQFWRILHEIALVYYGNTSLPLHKHVTLAFAEYKFRELLAWSNRLPPSLVRDERSSHHALILQ